MNIPTLRVLNVTGFLLVLTLNALANALPINGMTTGELSGLYPNRFVPAGFTFSIWGLIYLALLGFVIYQFLRPAQPVLQAIGYWFFISCLANGSWILAWHYQLPVVALGIMLLLLFSLLAIYRRLLPFRWAKHWPAILPFQLYLGWITVATIANTTAVLVHLGWTGDPLPETAWAAIMAGVAAGAGLFFGFKLKDIPYMLVILWALYGIFQRQADGGLLQTTLYIAMAAVLISTLAVVGLRLARPGQSGGQAQM